MIRQTAQKGSWQVMPISPFLRLIGRWFTKFRNGGGQCTTGKMMHFRESPEFLKLYIGDNIGSFIRLHSDNGSHRAARLQTGTIPSLDFLAVSAFSYSTSHLQC